MIAEVISLYAAIALSLMAIVTALALLPGRVREGGSIGVLTLAIFVGLAVWGLTFPHAFP